MVGIEKELKEGRACGCTGIEWKGGAIKGRECLWRVNAVAKEINKKNAVCLVM